MYSESSKTEIFSPVERPEIPMSRGYVVEEGVPGEIAHIMLITPTNDGYERVAMADMVLSDWRASTPKQKRVQLI